MPRKTMPSVVKIRSYWSCPERWEEQGVPWACQSWDDCCFACGWTGSTRCHILPSCQGGTEHPSNLHVLCPTCHEDSEWLSGSAYWSWFKRVDRWEVSDRKLRRRGVDPAKLQAASKLVQSLPPLLVASVDRGLMDFGAERIDSTAFLERLDGLGIDIRL